MSAVVEQAAPARSPTRPPMQHIPDGWPGEEAGRCRALTPSENAARSMIGVRFRVHGRDAAYGLDCVGLIALVLKAGGNDAVIPADYALRGGSADSIAALIDGAGLDRVAPPRPGDVLLCRTGPAQFHLAILVRGGIIHADAMLRRVVERPGPVPWPILAAWRPKETDSWQR